MNTSRGCLMTGTRCFMTSFALSSSCLTLKAIWNLSEAAGGKFFAVEKRNDSVRPVIIGSTWRRAPASLSVAEVNSDVANFLMSTYDNFLQFACQQDGASRCAQITELIASNWEVHDFDDPVVMQLDIINAFCSVRR